MNPEDAKRGLIDQAEVYFDGVARKAHVYRNGDYAPRLSDARRFAETLILCGDEASAIRQMQQDREGTLALLDLARRERAVTDMERLSTDHLGTPPYSLFYPFCSWMIAAIERRTKEAPLLGEKPMPE